MFGGHFYYATLRNVVSAFGTLFNDVNIVRKTNTGEVINMIKVPLAYGPRQKFLNRIDEQPGDLNATGRVAIKLPRMSFEITSFAYDSSTNLNRMSRDVVRPSDGGKPYLKGSYAPYIVNMQLNVLAKNQDDALQVIEQIMPMFQPDYTLAVKYTDDNIVDLPITLDSVSFSDDYEADYMTRRTLIYTLDFELKVRFYGPIKHPAGLIKNAFVDFRTAPGAAGRFILNKTAKVDPTEADFNDVWEIKEFNGIVPHNVLFDITTTSPATPFIDGEVVVGSITGSEGILQIVAEDTYSIKFPDNYFIIGENIIGTESNQQAEITNLSIGDLYE